jgi:hypothetical protein
VKCKHAQKMLTDYIDEVLDAEDSRRVQEHIAGCDSCRRELETLRIILGHINDAEVEYPPAHVWENFLPDLHRRIESEAILAFKRQRRQRFYALPGWMASAGVIVLILIASMMLRYYPYDRPFWLQSPENIEIIRNRSLPRVQSTSEPAIIAGIISDILITDAEVKELEKLKNFIQSEDPALAYQYYDGVTDYPGELDEEMQKQKLDIQDREEIIQFLLENGFVEFEEATITESDSDEFGSM